MEDGDDGGRRAQRGRRIRLGKGRIWPEEPAAAAMAEKVGRGRDWRRADGDEEAATAAADGDEEAATAAVEDG